MDIPFNGGPYDGRSVSVEAARSCLVIFTACRKPRRRRFAYLPVPSDWPAVLDGQIPAWGSPGRHCYELVEGPSGREFCHFPVGDVPCV